MAVTDIRRGIKPVSVVFDSKDGEAFVYSQLDCDAGGAGMSSDVGKGFLRDAEEVGFGFIREATSELALAVSFYTGSLHEAVGEPANSGTEAEVVEDGGAKELRHLAYVTDRGFGEAETIADAVLIGLAGGSNGGQVRFDSS